MTHENITSLSIGSDQPLKPGSALILDKLHRRNFAEVAVKTFGRVSPTEGFVFSIEGAWGSGKTSTLAMIEEIMLNVAEENRPIIVHFNPWLVGDRDALLRQFLRKIATAVKLADHAKDGKKVAKEIKAYSKAFDVVKLIPGAEPWASLAKSVFEKVGDVSESISEHKSLDIEQQRSVVQAALKKYPRPIAVFIDDIDRLFPTEVFEMIRIIKAVGDLPHVGYLLAWDPSYVTDALKQAGIPNSDGYLDKIVQARLTLPSLSLTAKQTLINDALSALPPEALENHFEKMEQRLSELYYSGLREILSQPRDVTRVFNAVATIEPLLRAEIIFSDIVGFAALMVKASPIFELIKQNPQFFVGRIPQDGATFETSENILKSGEAARSNALANCNMPSAIRRIIHRLFPGVAAVDGKTIINHAQYTDGHIGHPARLMIALQASISPTDISLVAARRFILQPTNRADILTTLSEENCLEFLESLGDIAKNLNPGRSIDLPKLCLDIARTADTEPFSTRSKKRSGGFTQRAEDVAIRAIRELLDTIDSTHGPAIATSIIEAKGTIGVSTELLVSNYSEERSPRTPLICSTSEQNRLLATHTENILLATKQGKFFEICNPGYTLWHIARLWPVSCKAIFDAIKEQDPSLDSFVLEFLSHSFDSAKGQAFSLPKEPEILAAYCPIEELRIHAEQRLTDSQVTYPLRSAWRSIIEGKKLYGIDGTEAHR